MFIRMGMKRCDLAVALLIFGIVAFIFHLTPLMIRHSACMTPGFVLDTANKRTYSYDHRIPLIFIGGMPRSGTTLMRVMLDAHPMVRCGEETRIIPRLLSFRQMLLANEEVRRLNSAGITDEVVDPAFAAFILEVVVRHGPSAERFCNKDPFTMKSAGYLSKIFPNSKYIFMVRDGRATVHSIITRNITITGFNLDDQRQCLEKWSSTMELMFNQCKQVGPDRCMLVYYEQLVLHPKTWMEKILEFLELPWHEAVLHHETLVGKLGRIRLSELEPSSPQVIKPVNLDALRQWVGWYPQDVVENMASIAPMLTSLGFDAYSNEATYGEPDGMVHNNNKTVREREAVWLSRAKALLAPDTAAG